MTSVHEQIIGVLGKEGVEVIDPFGEAFDPTTQQAVSQQEDPEVPEDTVVDVPEGLPRWAGASCVRPWSSSRPGGPRREE